MDLTLPYGRGTVALTKIPEHTRIVLPPVMQAAPIAMEQLPQVIAEKLGHPIGSPKLKDMLPPNGWITIVLPDKTRKAGQPAYLPVLLQWLLDRGVPRDRVRLLIGLGTHPGHAPDEFDRLLTPAIHHEFASGARISEANGHRADDFIFLGSTQRGTEVRLHRWLVESALVIQTGSITYHYYAGYSGGRKGILPGCSDARSIRQSHQLAFTRDPQGQIIRDPDARSGLLRGNPIVEDQIEAAAMLPVPIFLLNTITDPHDAIIELVAGDLVAAHTYGSTLVDQYYQAPLPELADVVIASAGGFPSDINLIQSHKALDNAVLAAKAGARIILLAECSQGTGNDKALDWAALGSADAVLQRLGEHYEIVGGTVEGILRKAEGYRVELWTSINADVALQFKLEHVECSVGSTVNMGDTADSGASVAILPAAGITMPVLGA